jgi:hypothetical protein
MLRRAQAAESAARGSQRRAAFRLTRQLIGGAIDAGYPADAIAECLGVTVGSLRNRTERNGLLSVAEIELLTNLSLATLLRWRIGGVLTVERIDTAGQPSYRAAEIIQALTVDNRYLNAATPSSCQ